MAFFGPGGTLLCKPVIALSQLIIDADKDWQAKGISNLKEAALGMQRGDVLARDSSVLVKLPPTSIGDELTCHGPGAALTWHAPPLIGGV
jgi:hypothetical protein